MELTVGFENGTALRTDFDAFFQVHFERVARAAALVTRDAGAGQELAQEAFTRLLERWDDMESDDHARNFAFKVAINLARSHIRKHARVLLYGLRRPDSPGSTRFEVASDAWFEIVGALGVLSPRQRACLVLVDYADLHSSEAAAILGTSEATLRVHLMRGRRALREVLGLAREEDLT